ncbi:zinc finger B-box domain-containing protein 1-like isoform X2 [Pecten maximus]|uniref:zinc finger B-box domain-containing protein 1-like isoform X2 n=1 Tax=Pecten maximus TaxID=6579 RepID=UPI0014591846|nr:zinc finger B-box domain-containing protein 1-like isoform X2 [Pecten maximus]
MRIEQPSTMSGFNINTNKKEDVSTKLKAINIRKAKGETKQLETESKKMEERLKELRMAMNREKEERERQGGGYWSRGQTGHLNSYASDVLNAKPAKAPAVKDGKRKVKVLKDSALDVPERPKHPGTMGYIAQQEASLTPRKRNVKGPKCGQCEEKKAAVSCVQCSEHYCATCFAAFHLRGALKKHRSVPLSASGPRVCMSPRPPQPSNGDRSIDFHAPPPPAEGAEAPYLAKIRAQRDRNSPEGASGSFDQNGLIGGEYDEAESAASFQQALLAWRSGNNGDVPMTPPKPAPKQQRISPRKVAYSPVKTPTVQVEFGTSTIEEKENIEIKFTSTMSYADRLLLKKHRRTEVDKMATPRLGDWEGHDEPDPRSRSITPFQDHRTRDRHQTQRQDPWLAGPSTPRVEPLFSSREEELQPVNFQSLYEAVKYSESGSSQPSRTVSGGMTIEEIDDDINSPESVIENYSALKRVEETSACLVQEMDDPQDWALNQNGSSSSSYHNVVTDTMPPKSRKSRRTPRTPGGKSKSRLQADPMIQSPDPEDYERVQPPPETEPNLPRSTHNRTKKSYVEYSSPDTSRTQPITTTGTETMKPPASSAKSRPQSSAKSRPQSSAKSRPQSSARSKSRQNSYTQSRPGSRAKSRANSRIEGEGVLTKGPSQGLLQVAMMNQNEILGDKQKSYSSAFNEFFMLGVQPEQTERTMTPSKHKDSRTEKVKVSSQLYQMAPRSWRPDSSLADTIDTQTVKEDSAAMEMVEATTPVPLDITDQPNPIDLGGRASVLSFINNEMDCITQKAEANMMSLLTKELSFDDETELQFGNNLEEEEEDDDFPDLPPTPSNLKVITPRPSSSVRLRPDSGTPRPSSSQSASHRDTRIGDNRPGSSFSVRSATVTPRPEDITPRPVSVTKRFASTTPRPGSRSRSQAGGEGRESRAIIVDGEDMSNYDLEGQREASFIEDQETLDNLEWELASETGRITANGKVSRMELEDTGSNGSADSQASIRSFSRMSQQDQGYDINSRLREDELTDDGDEEDDFEDEEDVKALH